MRHHPAGSIVLTLLVVALTVATSGASRTAPTGREYVGNRAETFVIRGATLIDGISDLPLANASVVVKDGLIATVGPLEHVVVPASAEIIEARGKFLIPGLWDTHAHLSYWGEDALEMLVYAGVTSIRELGGDPDEIGAWKREIDAGDRIGPSMVWCGPFIEGPEGDDEYRLKVATTDEARYAARALQAIGVDFLKIQPRIDATLVAALVDEAADLGLTVVGHLPQGLTAVEGSDLGLRSIEHLSPYLGLDDARLDRVYETYVANGTWMSPALFSLVAPIEARGEDPSGNQRILRARQIVRRAYEAGVPILVGSNFAYRDWPQRPGSGLHGEMRVLVEAGIPAMDVLRLATARAAGFAGAGDRSGAIVAGLRADMVLLEADPLADIHNTERVSLVILGGRRLRP